jgi:hypothetical protein
MRTYAFAAAVALAGAVLSALLVRRKRLALGAASCFSSASPRSSASISSTW